MGKAREPDPRRLVPLFHHRWVVPTVAHLFRLGGGSKFVTLQRRLGVGRETLKRALDAAREQGLVEPNPGYGHPMRPEYLLTLAGRRVGPATDRVLSELGEPAAEAAFRKWSMPALLAVVGTEGRFSQLRESLEPVTPRSLTLALRDLVGMGLLEREVKETFPPVTVYRVRAAAAGVLTALTELARRAPATS